MNTSLVLSDENVVNRIYHIRGKKVMIDRDLAELYDVETRVLIQGVKRNIDRFPDDFMFQLSQDEFKNLISQNVTSRWGGTRKSPYAFTEQGVAMLSSILKSKKAVAVNIQIIRVFTKMRELILANKDILLKLEEIEKKMLKQDIDTSKNTEEIQVIFQYLKELINPPPTPRKKVGFKHYD